MAKEYKRVLTRTCDFCSEKIEGDSVKTIRESVTLNNKVLGVEIKAVAVDGSRFTDDLCRQCLLKAASFAAEEIPITKNPFTEKVVDEGN